MIKSIVNVYLLNKIAFKLGLFNTNNLDDINKIFIPAISARSFFSILLKNKCNITFLDALIILSSSLNNISWILTDKIVMKTFKSLQNSFGIWPKKLLS